ncbi:NPCBM/NEW2 domain-containing protein [Calothrix sp. 336/3]|uniref:NPCBM/NEW2 domain-containing protein n=1 Tax=Calothrix sp. 336/3 TaxID=1337936 RepID=UPI0004E2D716|nr:NPCBM/NEW2 domain-containing protein [Calothrix sp. 336/3]AKG22766.1 hypothetical protein IJ00_17130 [Calothrix sp. 336/3]
MTKISSISLFILTILVTSSLNTVTSKIAQAQTGVSLLRAKCVNSGLGNVREETKYISIGRTVYTSRFYLGPGYRSANLTCKIKPDNANSPFQVVNLGFGMADSPNQSPNVDIKVYLDGKLGETRTVTTSQEGEISVDVSNVSDISIEATCSSQTQYCDRVYFFNANLQKQAPPRR